MAKKLLVGTYTFDASERLVKVSGNLAAEKFLLITNITDNKIIYNFADATLGFASKSYSVTDDKTSFTLKYDTSSMSDTDVLQIFTDNDYTEITPSEDLIDPVGKMRISNPQNLIDTDFEYGLQGTKWETLQVINNIPTILIEIAITLAIKIVKIALARSAFKPSAFANSKFTVAANRGLQISINTIKTMLAPIQTNKTSVMFTDKISPKSRPIRSILINESIPNRTKPIAKTECAKRPSNASSGRLVLFCKKSSDKAIKQETAKTAMIKLKFIA